MDISYTDGNKNKIRSISSDYFNHIIEFLDDQFNAHKLFYSDFADSYIIYKACMTREQVEYLTKHNKYDVYGGDETPEEPGTLRGTHQYMGQLNPYLLHKTDRL
jgi:hypothetical protein